MKKALKIALLITLLIGALFILTACGNQDNKTNETAVSNSSKKVSSSENSNSSTNKIETTANKTDDIDVESLSNEEKIEHYIHALLKETYGDKLDSAKIYVDKMYTAKEAAKDETLKSLKLGEKDIAFEVSIHIKPVDGADVFEFTVPDGVYDEDTGWVSEIHRLGVLKYNSTDKSYSISNYGTGW